MVQISIPEGVRPFVAAVAKYHFWILAALVPLVLLPLVFMANGTLTQQIASRRTVIDSKLGEVSTVTGLAPHPNEQWSTTVEADAAEIEDQTRAEWQRLWHGQQFLRIWPKLLDDDFIDAVTSLPPGGELKRPLLIRYKNRAPRLVRELPARMGVPNEIPESTAAQPAAQPAADAAPAKPKAPVVWNAADQQKVLASFEWTPVPSTTQVRLAQEELWVYGMFCDIVAGFNKGATGSHDAPISVVDQLTVGFPALQPQPGDPGVQRIVVPAAVPAAAGEQPLDAPMDMPLDQGGEGVPAATPVHPRFGGVPQPTDDDFRSWIYVDFDGRGLTAQQLTELADMKMVHLMPFVLRVVIDQRQLDRLLTTLASWPVPIDVRQVRINTDGGGSPGPDEPATADGRPFDVRVELRGTVALATPPDQPAGPAAEETP
jgi:hypothetical protein